jgi:hypothetical protein
MGDRKTILFGYPKLETLCNSSAASAQKTHEEIKPAKKSFNFLLNIGGKALVRLVWLAAKPEHRFDTETSNKMEGGIRLARIRDQRSTHG